MKYTNLDGIGKRASRLVYGTVQPVYAGSREEAFEALDAAWEAGFRIFDTAHSYGEDAHAEKNFGAWIEARGVQDEVIILDKGFNPGQKGCPDVYSAQMLRDQIEESLQNLRTDCLDIYILHRDDPRYPVDEIVEVLNEYHDKGAILRFGGSNWTWQRIQEANDYASAHGLIPFEVSSPNFSLARQVVDPYGGGCVSICGEDAEEVQGWYRENQMAVVSYSSLAHGFLSGRLDGNDETSGSRILDEFGIKGFDYPENYERLRRCEKLAAEKGVTVPQLAVAWLYHQGLNEFAVISTGSPERMQSNIDALDIEITPEENDYLNLK